MFNQEEDFLVTSEALVNAIPSLFCPSNFDGSDRDFLPEQSLVRVITPEAIAEELSKFTEGLHLIKKILARVYAASTPQSSVSSSQHGSGPTREELLPQWSIAILVPCTYYCPCRNVEIPTSTTIVYLCATQVLCQIHGIGAFGP